MTRYKGAIDIGFPTAIARFTFDVDDLDIEDMSEEEKEDYLSQAAYDHALSMGMIDVYCEGEDPTK